MYCKSHHRASSPVIVRCTLAQFWNYTNKITLPPRNCKVFLGSGLCWLQQKTFMSFPSCLQRLGPVALRGARGVMGAGSAQRVPRHREAPPPLPLLPWGPHIPSGKPLRTPPMPTHTQFPHLGRSPASPDVGDEGLHVPRQHGDHIGDDEGGRGPADEQRGHESHAGHAARHRRPGHGRLGGSALQRRPGSGDCRDASGRACPAARSPGDAPPPLASLHFRFSAALPAPDGGGEPGQPWAPSPFTAGGTWSASESFWPHKVSPQPVSLSRPALRAAHAPSGQGGGR